MTDRTTEQVRQHAQASEHINHAVDVLNALTLPQIDRVTGELTSTRKNRIVSAAIAETDKSLRTLLEAVTARYENLGANVPTKARPTMGQLLRLLSAASERSRRWILSQLANELIPQTSPDVEPQMHVAAGEISSLDDVDRVKVIFLTRYVFGDTLPSRERFVAWFNGLKESELRDTELRTVAHAINLFRDRFDLKLLCGNREVTIGVSSPGGGRGTRHFYIQPLKGQKGKSSSLGHMIPTDLKLL